MNTFNGKLALVTGGSSGIGLAVSKKLAAQGANVVILGRDPKKLETAKQEIEASRLSPTQKIITIQADVSDAAQTASMVQGLLVTDGAPDILINSAGVARPGEFEKMELDLYHWMMDINYFGTVNAIKSVLPAMIHRGSGHIVNISSIAGFLGTYGYTAYGATKFAIRGFSDALRYEIKPYGIQLSIVYPPDTKTPQLEEDNRYKMPVLVALEEGTEVMTAEAVADSILNGIARNRYVITPGFSSRFYYFLVGILGWGLVYPVMDLFLADARSKVARNQAKYAHQHVANPDQGGDQKVN